MEISKFITVVSEDNMTFQLYYQEKEDADSYISALIRNHLRQCKETGNFDKSLKIKEFSRYLFPILNMFIALMEGIEYNLCAACGKSILNARERQLFARLCDRYCLLPCKSCRNKEMLFYRNYLGDFGSLIGYNSVRGIMELDIVSIKKHYPKLLTYFDQYGAVYNNLKNMKKRLIKTSDVLVYSDMEHYIMFGIVGKKVGVLFTYQITRIIIRDGQIIVQNGNHPEGNPSGKWYVLD